MKKETITNADHQCTVTLHVSEEGFCYCPVCGSPTKNTGWRPYAFNGTPSYDICGSCNFQFGFDDGGFPGPYDQAWERYRQKWLHGKIKDEGPPRLTLSEKRKQLKNIEMESTLELSKTEKRKLTRNKRH